MESFFRKLLFILVWEYKEIYFLFSYKSFFLVDLLCSFGMLMTFVFVRIIFFVLNVTYSFLFLFCDSTPLVVFVFGARKFFGDKNTDEGRTMDRRLWKTWSLATMSTMVMRCDFCPPRHEKRSKKYKKITKKILF